MTNNELNTEPHLNGEAKISFTIRDLLSELKAMVLAIDVKLDNKAEKLTVENLMTRLTTIETERRAEREYGTQLLTDYRDLLKDHAQVKLDINTLQTNKKDKEAFDVKWIPIFASLLGVVGEFIYLFYVH